MAQREKGVLLLQHHLDLGFIYASIAIAIHREKSLAAQCEWRKCDTIAATLNKAKKARETIERGKNEPKVNVLAVQGFLDFI